MDIYFLISRFHSNIKYIRGIKFVEKFARVQLTIYVLYRIDIKRIDISFLYET